MCCLSSLYIQVDVTLMAFNKRKKSGRKKHQRVYNSDVGHKLVVLFYFPGGYRSVSSSGIPEKTNFSLVFACVYNPSFCLLYKREERNGRKIMSGVALPLRFFFFSPFQLLCCLMERLESLTRVFPAALRATADDGSTKLLFPTSIWAAGSSTLQQTWDTRLYFSV